MRDEGLDGKFPSCLRASRGFEEHVSEPASDQLDAASWDGRGVTLVTGWWESNHDSRLTIHESRYREVSRNEAAVI
jgi:hypothetical protein